MLNSNKMTDDLYINEIIRISFIMSTNGSQLSCADLKFIVYNEHTVLHHEKCETFVSVDYPISIVRKNR